MYYSNFSTLKNTQYLPFLVIKKFGMFIQKSRSRVMNIHKCKFLFVYLFMRVSMNWTFADQQTQCPDSLDIFNRSRPY